MSDFVCCDTCRPKAPWAGLCSGCQQNRNTIERMEKRLEEWAEEPEPSAAMLAAREL